MTNIYSIMVTQLDYISQTTLSGVVMGLSHLLKMKEVWDPGIA